MATERRNFTDEEINKVWEKATKQPNNNPDVFRKDYAGAWIRRDDYGKRDKPYGWKNNESKGDDYPYWKTVLSSEANKNIESVKNWKVDE